MEQYLNLEKLAATAFAIDWNLKTQAGTAGHLISDIWPATVHRRWPVNVCFWHLADIPPALTNVRYGGKSGHDANGPLCRLMTYCGHWRSNISVGVALIYLCAHVRLFTRTQAFSRATTEHIPQVFWVWGKAVALLRYQLKLKHKSSV